MIEVPNERPYPDSDTIQSFKVVLRDPAGNTHEFPRQGARGGPSQSSKQSDASGKTSKLRGSPRLKELRVKRGFLGPLTTLRFGSAEG